MGTKIWVYLAAGSTSAGCAREKKINEISKKNQEAGELMSLSV